MPTTRPKSTQAGRSGVLRSVDNPLAFFVLNLLIIEATLTIVLTCSRLSEDHIWIGFLWMIGIFFIEVLIVAGFTIFAPKNLLYGKEEHRELLLEPSALKDQIEDVIAARVKAEALNLPES